jgi:hypothetical protein
MTMRNVLALAAGALLLSGTAAAESFPPAELCEMYQRDLRQDLMLSSDYHPQRNTATEALEQGAALCLEGEPEAGVDVLKSGIASLGLPIRPYE